MKNYSTTILGIIGTVLLPILVKAGFSDSCSGEISGIVVPFIAALPGAAVAWVGRVRAGGVTPLGFKKPSV